MSSFKTSPFSVSSILLAVYVSGGFEVTADRLLAFDIGVPGTGVMVWDDI